MTDSELPAFVRKGGSFKGGKGRKGKWGRKGAFRKGDRRGDEPPPRGRSDLLCINCCGTGHMYRELLFLARHQLRGTGHRAAS